MQAALGWNREETAAYNTVERTGLGPRHSQLWGGSLPITYPPQKAQAMVRLQPALGGHLGNNHIEQQPRANMQPVLGWNSCI